MTKDRIKRLIERHTEMQENAEAIRRMRVEMLEFDLNAIVALPDGRQMALYDYLRS